MLVAGDDNSGRMNLRLVSFGSFLLLALLLAVPVSAESEHPAGGGAEASPAGAPAAGAPAAGGPGAGRQRREAPKAMVLCRGPRGAVYARDVNDGCRNVQLNAANLVDFGAGDDCLLRRASSFDPEGEKTATVGNCEDVCKAADDDRTCIIGLRRLEAEWATFTAAESFGPGDSELRDATIVCCKP